MGVKALLRIPFRNLTLKLAAAFLATALFLHVRRETERVDELQVPLIVEGAVAAVAPLPDTVRIRLTAPARQLDALDVALLRVHVRVLDLPPGSTVLRPLSNADLLLPEGFRPIQAEVLAPAPLLLRVSPAPRAGEAPPQGQ